MFHKGRKRAQQSNLSGSSGQFFCIMVMGLRSKRTGRPVLGDIQNKKRSASEAAKANQGGPSDAKRLKSSKGDGQWVTRKKDEVTNPLQKKETTSVSSTKKTWPIPS
ncbi:hypothetical protein TrRE_jg4991 [Triparma retinervis]|uniref:Uncharacterized protein n=1 Tax=Triparma retinervis TaxID=2557542 RepID=A0A9W7A2K5_9STRA|nr:hypothetical protein TrRE_jg4991 [Triparma retinervis]